MSSTTADKVADALFQYICLFGKPRHVPTDFGPQFASEIFYFFLELRGTRLAHSSPGHPAANGVSERVNTSVKATVATLQAQNVPFEKALLIHQAIYNASIHSTTGYSPNLVQFGPALPLIIDSWDFSKDFPHLDKGINVQNIVQQTRQIWKACFANINSVTDQFHEYQNKTRKPTQLQIEDIVYISY